MTRDEIQARIDDAQAELDGLQVDAGEDGEPEADAWERQEHLKREIASLRAQIAEA